jgi:carbamoyl-phosphate synthase large subunit
MGIDRTFGVAFAKSQTAVGNKLPDRGSVFLSLADRDKPAGLTAARRFADLGFTLVATAGTAAACEAEGIPIGAVVAKLGPGERGDPDAPGVRGVPDAVVVGVDAVDLIASGKVNLVVNTPRGRGPRADGAHIRLAASAHGVPCLTTIAAALAAAAGIAESRTEEPRVRSLQEYHRDAQLRLPL